MLWRVLALLFAVSIAGTAQTMSVNQLREFLRSEAELKHPDKQVAGFLGRVKLSERLDDRTVEELQGLGVGPKTLAALRTLRDQSQALPAAKPAPAPAPKAVRPPPSSEEQAAILDEVREYALNYSRNLPDFICTEVTRRFAAPAPGTKYAGKANDGLRWQKIDELTTRLTYFEQKEDYKLILHNSTPVAGQDPRSAGGSQSFGDFGSMLRQIFEPATQARFEWDHWGLLRNQWVMAFAYRVDQSRSQYHIAVDNGKLDIITGYHGLVEVDPKSHAVLRVTVEADNIPPDFPVKSAKDTLDYDYTELSGHRFLLPLKAAVLMNGGDFISRLDKEFRLYRKYSAESAITFDEANLPPLPEEKTKETSPAEK